MDESSIVAKAIAGFAKVKPKRFSAPKADVDDGCPTPEELEAETKEGEK